MIHQTQSRSCRAVGPLGSLWVLCASAVVVHVFPPHAVGWFNTSTTDMLEDSDALDIQNMHLLQPHERHTQTSDLTP